MNSVAETAQPSSILYLKPYFSHTVWGGTKIRECFGYDESGDDIGECWGISAHPDGMTYVAGGEYNGRSLADLWENERHLFGSSSDRFPLLVKIIDARDDLSIQVHPDDEYARKYENGSLGKSECWYILDCSDDAKLIIGHNAKTREELADMIQSGKWNELIREVPVKKGDFIEIVPGTMHAIKGGVTLLETQQNSDITYRVFDYGRLWNGRPRQLHTRQSMDVITVPASAPLIRHFDTGIENVSLMNESGHAAMTGSSFDVMCQNPRYSVYKANVRNDSLELPMPHSFMNATVIAGSGELCGHPVKLGDNVILTTACSKLRFDGQMLVILSGVD